MMRGNTEFSLNDEIPVKNFTFGGQLVGKHRYC